MNNTETVKFHNLKLNLQRCAEYPFKNGTHFNIDSRNRGRCDINCHFLNIDSKPTNQRKIRLQYYKFAFLYHERGNGDRRVPYAGPTETENVIPKIEGSRPLAYNAEHITMFLHKIESDKRCADNADELASNDYNDCTEVFV